MDRQEQDLRIRTMAQDAHLDEDLESMVPPTSSKTTFIVLLSLLCLVAVAGLAIFLSTT